MIAAQGVRVVRGEGWNNSDVDGGEGGLGTIVDVQNDVDKAIATVIWDNGVKWVHELGKRENDRMIIAHDCKQNGESFELLCHACGASIVGSLWNCVICANLDLCSNCYMDDLHDVTHAFRRKISRDSQWVMVASRSCSKKVAAKGLFPGATVERNTTLRNTVLRNTFQSLDEYFGRIINYESDIGNAFSAVCVVWNQNFRQAVYQLGRDGKVEVRCTVYAFGPSYYVGHLPSLVKMVKLKTKPRGYTVSQFPLPRALQYTSLRSNFCDSSSVDVGAYSLSASENPKSQPGPIFNNGYHRYKKSPTVDTKLIRTAEDAQEKAKYGHGIRNKAASTFGAAFVHERSKCFPLTGSNEKGENVVKEGKSCSESRRLVGSYEEDVSHQERMDAKRVIMMPSCKLEMTKDDIHFCQVTVGDDVRLKEDKSLSMSTETKESYAGKVGRLQYIDEEQSCFVHFPFDNKVIKLPLDSIEKADHVEYDQSSGRHGGPKMIKDQTNLIKMGTNALKENDANAANSKQWIQVNSNRTDFPTKDTRNSASNSFTDSIKLRDSRSVSGCSNDSGTQKSDDIILCRLCRQNECDVKFEPCGHRVTCSHCSVYFKKCFFCHEKIHIKGWTKTMSNCAICCDKYPDVRFLPCNHKVACKDCSMEMKSCLKCKTKISEKIVKGGRVLKIQEQTFDSLQQLFGTMEKLKCKVMGLEGSSKCRLCSQNSKNLFFQCGHSTCEACGESLIICPTCHKKIEVKTLHDYHFSS